MAGGPLVRNSVITVNVNFPALDNLVNYLKGAQQAKIDALTAQVTGLTKGLNQSSSELQTTVEETKA